MLLDPRMRNHRAFPWRLAMDLAVGLTALLAIPTVGPPETTDSINTLPEHMPSSRMIRVAYSKISCARGCPEHSLLRSRRLSILMTETSGTGESL